MVLVNTKDKGVIQKSNVIPINIKLDKPESKPEEIEWNMSKRILVGKRSDGYQIMQALAPVFAMGWSMSITKGDKEPLKIILADDKGRSKRSGEGTTFSVALRRMSVGMSRQFSHMAE